MNTYFQFKQFIIHQDRCAQKVSEMACLFGAWIKLQSHVQVALDIGSGTGLLSLMLAQQYPMVRLDAVELNEDTYLQLVQNIKHSPFAERVKAVQIDIRQFEPRIQYDVIVVNPPFHEKQLISKQLSKNIAWHSETLALNELLACVHHLLSSDGEFFLLWPSYRLQELLSLLNSYSFFLCEKVHIKHSRLHTEKILMLKITRHITKLLESDLYVKENGDYSPEVRKMLSPFYLKL